MTMRTLPTFDVNGKVVEFREQKHRGDFVMKGDSKATAEIVATASQRWWKEYWERQPTVTDEQLRERERKEKEKGIVAVPLGGIR